jgi:orotate phosphoribosyltransferase-like protein
MSKMAELHADITELIEQGMSEKFIAVALNVPIDFVRSVFDERMALEELNYYDPLD